MEVHALAAEHGDCIVLSYGVDKAHFRLVVDAGVADTAGRLKRVLNASTDAVWELLVVTHIDHDHIGGTLSLLSDKSIASRFNDIWFNGRQHLELDRETMSVAEGKELTQLLDGDGISWNQMFGKGAVCLEADDTPVRKTLPGSNAAITILSPSKKGLAKLGRLWVKFEEQEKQKAEETARAESAAAQPATPDVEVLSAVPLSIADLADKKTDSDRSVPNGSSIAFIFEYAGIRILLGADAHADVLLKSVAKLSREKLNLDLFKLPHHGSSANVTKRLTMRMPARRYLLTTDGKRHKTHPCDVAIARALIAMPDAELLFNYKNMAYERWFSRPPEPGYSFTVSAGVGDDGILVRLVAAPSQDYP